MSVVARIQLSYTVVFVCVVSSCFACCVLCACHHTLVREDAWFELLFLRTSTVKEITGGMGAVMISIIKLFFCSGHDPTTAGVSLQLHTGLQTIMWLKLGQVIADEAALHMLWGQKGLQASSLVCCVAMCSISCIGLKPEQQLTRRSGA